MDTDEYKKISDKTDKTDRTDIEKKSIDLLAYFFMKK
jgi:hypothetical protein